MGGGGGLLHLLYQCPPSLLVPVLCLVRRALSGGSPHHPHCSWPCPSLRVVLFPLPSLHSAPRSHGLQLTLRHDRALGASETSTTFYLWSVRAPHPRNRNGVSRSLVAVGDPATSKLSPFVSLFFAGNSLSFCPSSPPHHPLPHKTLPRFSWGRIIAPTPCFCLCNFNLFK